MNATRFNCENCSKSFSTLKTLSAHTLKFHPIAPTNEVEIDTRTINSVETQTMHSGDIMQPKRIQQCEIETNVIDIQTQRKPCICQNPKPIMIEAKQQRLKHTKSKGTRIVDILKSGNGIQCLMDDYNLLQISHSQLEVKLFDQNYKYGEMLEKQPIDIHIGEYITLLRDTSAITRQHQKVNSSLYSKLMTECNVQYATDFELAVFDIETVNYSNHTTVPEPDDLAAEIRMIQFQIGEEDPIVYINNRMEHVFESEFELVVFESERLMVDSFIQLIAKQKQTIWVGFNASSSGLMEKLTHLEVVKSRHCNGYDMKWLLRRSSYIMTVRNKLQQVGDRLFEATVSIDELPSAYFVDMQEIAHAGLKPEELREMKNYSLNEYTRIYGVEEKVEEHTYVQMSIDFSTFASDISKHIEYGVEDIRVLQQLLTKLNFKTEVIAKMEMDRVGLECVLEETVENILQIHVNREAINGNHAPSYEKKDCTTAEKYKGADTGVNELYKCVGMSNVVENDFSALYPSIIIKFNISESTIITAEQAQLADPSTYYRIDLNCHLQDLPAEYAYFTNLHDGNLRTMSKYYTSLRAEIRAQMEEMVKANPDVKSTIEYKILDKKQLYIKLQANTLYGAQGAQSSPHFNRIVVRAVCAGGREALHQLKRIFTERRNDILAWDTDAVNTQILQTEELNWETADSITKYANNKLLEHYGSDHLQVTCDELMKIVIFSKCKKSYARIEYDRKMLETVCIKGVNWSTLNAELHPQIKIDARRILEASITDKPLCVSTIHNEYVAELKEHIKTENYSEIAKWSHVLKACSNDSVVKQLKASNPDMLVDKFDVFYRMKRSANERKSLLAMTFESLNAFTIKQIDVQLSVSRYTRQLDKIFTLEKQGALKSEMQDYEELDDHLVVRIEELNQATKYEELEISTLATLIEKTGHEISYHEVFEKSHCRFFADIDHLPPHIQDPVSFVFQALSELGFRNFELGVSTAHSVSKESWHIVSDLWVSRAFAQHIAKEINEKALLHIDTKEENLIDMAPHRLHTSASLRLPHCIKIDKKSIINRRFEIENGTFEDMLITNSENTTIVNEMPCTDPRYRVIPEQTSDISYSAHPQSISALKAYLLEHHPNTIIGEISGIIAKLHGACPLILTRVNSIVTSKSNHGCYARLTNKLTLCCHSDNCKPLEIAEFKKDKNEVQIAIPLVVPEPNQFDVTQSSRYLDVEITHSLSAIRASVGLGKTEQIIKHLKSKPQTSIFISTRQALALDVCRRFEDAGLHPMSYKEHSGKLIALIDRPLIIQYESLERLADGECVDVLVFDEQLSLFEEVDAKLGARVDRLSTILVKLARNCKQLVCMDGLLTPNAVKLFESIKDTKADWICNDYKPYSDYSLDFIPSQKGAFTLYQEQVINQLRNNKKVFCFISEKNKLKELLKAVLEQSVLEADEIKYVTGDSLADDILDPKHKHFTAKFALLKDFSQVKNCELLCFTSAITSGVDFSLDHFDVGMHFGKAQSCSPNQVVQAMFRIRKLYEKKHILYYTHAKYALSYIPNQICQPSLLQHAESNLEVISKSFVLQSKMMGSRYILEAIVDLGLEVQIVEMDAITTQIEHNDVEYNEFLINGLESAPASLVAYCSQMSTAQRQGLMKDDALLADVPNADKAVQEYFEAQDFHKTVLAIGDKYVHVEASKLSVRKIEKLLDSMKAYIRMAAYTDELSHISINKLGLIHAEQIKNANNAKRNNLASREPLDVIGKNQQAELKLLESIIDKQPIGFVNLEGEATPEDIAKIKQLVRKLCKPEAVTKLKLKLNFPDLSVMTQLEHWEAFKAHFVEIGKW